ncbi:PAS domain-containing protein [Parapedobacter deserti]|uniref:histidine kinase n=1 Tax=Parapedobacter deserti TaxID=1912957 RepID=A0ABV7JPQ0_9SPHI
MIGEINFSTVFHALPTPSLVLLPDAPKFTMVDASDSYAELTGKTREELIGKGFFDVFRRNPYLNDNNWSETFETVLREKKPHRVAAQKYASPITGSPARVDIKYLDNQNIPVLDERGEIKLIIRSLTDVTEAVNYNEFLQGTQEVAKIGSWEVNLARQTVFWSQGLREIYEVEPDYHPDFDSALAFYTNEKDREELMRAFTKAANDGTVFRTVFPITTAKRNQRWLFTVGKADLVKNTCVRVYGISMDITEKKYTEEALVSSEHNFHSLIQTIDGIVWEADAETDQLTFVSEKVEQILGYSAEEWAEPSFWMTRIYEPDRERVVSHHRQQTASLTNHSFDCRMVRKDGYPIWIQYIVSVIAKSGKPRWLRGIMIDITRSKRLAELNQLERTILELNARKALPIEQILTSYLEGIEAIFPGMHCSIHRVRHNRLLSWIAPSLPKSYLKAIHNLPIGEYTGSCGSAAFSRKPVMVSDISTDRRWVDYKHIALKYGLRSSWSYPIIDANNEVTAVLGMYYKAVRNPDSDEMMSIDRAGAFLNVILANHYHSELEKENELTTQQTQELAQFGTWQWDVETNHVIWSDTLYNIYGLDKKTFYPSLENYLSRIHDDDRQRVFDIIQNTLETRQDTVFEERIVRPTQEIRHIKSWGRVVLNPDGSTNKIIGACLDITETKHAELSLKRLHTAMEQQLQVLEESEKKYSDLFHLSPLPMWVYDLESYRFLDVNDAAINHYGYTKEEFLSMTIKDIRPPEEIPKVVAAVNISRQNEKLFSKGIYFHRKKDGKIIHVEIQSNTITFHGRKARIVLAQDISEKLAYIDAIEAQNRKLQEIAWMQSHKVRAPLARIMGLVDLIQNFPESGVPNDELLRAIHNSATELDDILREITGKAEKINF